MNILLGLILLSFRSFFQPTWIFYAAALNSVPKSTLGSLNDKL